MNVYFNWFAGHLDLIAKYCYQDALFDINYNGHSWFVGYGYMEDYEGFYFFKNLSASNRMSIAEALDKSMALTKPLIAKLTLIDRQLTCIEQPEEGISYTSIMINRDGELTIRNFVGSGFDGTRTRHVFLSDIGKHILSSRFLRMVFPAIESSLLEKLND